VAAVAAELEASADGARSEPQTSEDQRNDPAR
jgi:hypothetical protein